MTDPVGGARVSVSGNPAPVQTCASRGVSTAAEHAQSLVGFGGPPALPIGEPLVQLTSADPQENRLARVPKSVMQIVAAYLELPQQVALGSTSRQMRATITAQVSYTRIHSVFGGLVSQDRTLGREISAETRRGASLYDEYRRDFAGNTDSGIELYEMLQEDTDESADRLDALCASRSKFRSQLPDLLSPYVDLYVRTRSPEPFGALFSACDRFLQATTAADKKQIYFQHLRPAATAVHRRGELGEVVKQADLMVNENRMEEMQALVSARVESLVADPDLRRAAANRLIDNWTRQLVQLFSGASA